MAELADQFATLFAGRNDAVGGNEGRAIRPPADVPYGADRHWWHKQIADHLSGTGEPIGVYPLRNSGPDGDHHPQDLYVVHWGCIDWDEGYEESWPDALNTHNILNAFGITSWIERSRSKGWHLWVFADTWVPAKTMRDALVTACQIVGAPIKEVNPKQTELKDGGLGNYVRLPYPSADDDETWTVGFQTVINPKDNEQVMAPRDFGVEALASRVGLDALTKLAERRTSSERTSSDMIDVPTTELSVDITRKLDGLAYSILRDGPAAGTAGDRSATLFKLAAQMWDTGRVTKAEAWAVMLDADIRFGKYQERDDMDSLWTTFDRAWGGTE